MTINGTCKLIAKIRKIIEGGHDGPLEDTDNIDWWSSLMRLSMFFSILFTLVSMLVTTCSIRLSKSLRQKTDSYRYDMELIFRKREYIYFRYIVL
jgi:hypothetical protein